MENKGTPNGENASSLVALAESIIEQTKAMTEIYQDNNLATPRFAPGMAQYPSSDEFTRLRSSLRASFEDLKWLVEGFRSDLGTYRIARALQSCKMTGRCGLRYDEMLEAATESSAYREEYPFEADGTRCPFYKRHGLPIFEFYEKYADKAGRFARAMAGATRMDRHIIELRDCFAWGDTKRYSRGCWGAGGAAVTYQCP
ncbi:hypothetical protein F4808DRAFT_133114 [Astrocystis sublimbata]|nr:hypothetical protein F4808DRAFT_133114 [Astrocystis sublimbata]